MTAPRLLNRLNPALAACLVLAACGGQPGSGGVAPTEPALTDRSMADETVANEADTSVATATPGAAVAPGRQPVLPEALIGLSGERISALFGTPIFVRRDPPGEFWRYRSKTCVLELFFYRRDGAWTVDHIDTRGSNGAAPGRAACVTALQKTPK